MKSNDRAALYWSCSFSESGMVEAASAQCRAFPRELPSENRSRNGRVIPLMIYGVSAPE